MGMKPLRVLLVSANRERLPSPAVPLGVLYVAGAARARGHEVRVLDLCFEADPEAAVRDAIGEYGPDVVGLGVRNLHTNAYDGTEHLLAGYDAVAAAIRASTRAPLVVGGAGFSLRPRALLERLGADHGVVGEGEDAFAKLLDALGEGRTPPRLAAEGPGSGLVALGRGSPGVPRAGAALDLLAPPARDLVDPRYYAFDGTDNVQTKRGCAFECAYCDYPDLEGHKVRVRDPEAVADEFEQRAHTKDVSCIFFVDSVFNVPRSHALAVCRAIERRRVGLPWVCYASPVGLDDEMVGAMARAGCVGVEVGSDSGSDEILARLSKPFATGAIVRARELFRRHGIQQCHTFVVGAAGETPEEAERTLEFVERLEPDVAVFMAFMEDREERGVHVAAHRDALLALLLREAHRHSGWVVPELGVRFGPKVLQFVERNGLKGPSWLHLRGRAPARLVSRSTA